MRSAASDYGTAYWHLREALEQGPDHSASLNMLAMVKRRVGLAQTCYAAGRLRREI